MHYRRNLSDLSKVELLTLRGFDRRLVGHSKVLHSRAIVPEKVIFEFCNSAAAGIVGLTRQWCYKVPLLEMSA